MFPSDWTSGMNFAVVAAVFVGAMILAFAICRVIAVRQRFPKRCPHCGGRLERWAEKCPGCGAEMSVYPE